MLNYFFSKSYENVDDNLREIKLCKALCLGVY